MRHGQIEGTEILVEWHINQIIVYIEKEGVLVVLWGLAVCYPVESIRDDLNWFSIGRSFKWGTLFYGSRPLSLLLSRSRLLLRTELLRVAVDFTQLLGHSEIVGILAALLV